MRSRIRTLLIAVVAISGCGALLLILGVLDFRPPRTPSAEPEKTAWEPVTHAPPANTTAAPVAPLQPPQGDSLSEVISIVQRAAADGTSAADLYRKLAALGLKDRSWWRNADEVSALFDLISDPSLADEYRTLAAGLYLGAAPQDQILQNSAVIQRLASGGSDNMVCSVLQGMADRSVAPAALTKEILASDTRGTGAKCYAWYAARLTQKNDLALAAIAFAVPESPMTEATKVGFDYLASGSFQDQFAADPRFRQGVEECVLRVKSLQPDAGPMDLANGDAFIRAIPSILPADSAAKSLFAMLREIPNPEMRLSAIEQLVSIHLSGTQDLSQELHAARNDVATLFPDAVKQTRAKKRLNRAASPHGN